MSIRYGQKAATSADKIISSSFMGYNRFNNLKKPIAAATSTDRPTDLLAPPVISSSEQKIALLVFISNDSSNFLAFTVAGNYTVDWGDGTAPQNVSSGTAAQYSYNFATFDPTNSTLTSDGFKQAWVIITPQGGANITSVNLQTRHSSMLANNYYSQPIHEIYLSAPNLTSLTIGTLNSTTIVYSRRCRYINFINTGVLTSFANLLYNMHSLLLVDVGVTAAVTNMSGMFAFCWSLLDVRFSSNANLSGLLNAASMFYDCRSLSVAPLFNTAAITNMSTMFYQCYSLESVPLYDTRSCTTMSQMFQFCYALKTVPAFNTIRVTDMGSMFSSCHTLVSVPLFNTIAVTQMSFMFNQCFSLETVPLFNTITATTMASMFSTCYSLQNVPAFNAANVLSMDSMFSSCYSLINVGLMNTVKVTSFNSIFQNCFSLKTVPLFNTIAVTSMASMFNQCFSLITVPLFNTIAVTSMASMFRNCHSLSSVPLFNTANVLSFDTMFLSCHSLKVLPLFNTIKVTSFNTAFNACISLMTIPAFNTVAATDMTNAFNACYSLTEIPAMNLNLVGALTLTSCFSLATFNATNLRVTASFNQCKLAKDALETIFTNLGTALVGGTRTLTISNNWGAPTPVTLTGTPTAGSTTITMANTTGLSAGMQVTGTNTSLTTGRAVTFTDAGDLVNLTAHGLSNGDEVAFSVITTTTGIVINTIYFVVNAAADTFQVASTLGGAALPLTTNGSGTVKYNSTIVSIVPNTSVTMSRPMAGGSAQTLAFRLLGTYKAILKGFAVTG
jgi:surface protein